MLNVLYNGDQGGNFKTAWHCRFWIGRFSQLCILQSMSLHGIGVALRSGCISGDSISEPLRLPLICSVDFVALKLQRREEHGSSVIYSLTKLGDLIRQASGRLSCVGLGAWLSLSSTSVVVCLSSTVHQLHTFNTKRGFRARE